MSVTVSLVLCVTSAIIGCFLVTDSADALVLSLALIGKSSISGGWAAVQIFSAEKFPTLIRNIGIASCALAARVGGIVAPQIGLAVSCLLLSHNPMLY